MSTRMAALAAAMFCLSTSIAPAAEPAPLKVTVTNGPVQRELPIVRFELPAEWARQTFDVVELRGDAATCPVQPDTDAGANVVCWRANKPVGPHETVTFELRPNPHVESRDVVSARIDAQGVTLAGGKHNIVQYNVRTVDPPEGVPAVYRRSGHLHPVWTPSGRIVTAEFPADHIHQHAMFSAWVNTEFDGRKTDFWNQGGKTGTVVHRDLKETDVGPVFAQFTTLLEHQALTDGTSPRPAILETMRVRGYASPRPELNVFDVELEQRAASEIPLKVLKYHYGGFAVRGASEWFQQPESNMLTSEGKNQKDGNETRPKWVNMHGLIDGQRCGITVIPHPGSDRSPQPVRLHPSKPYFVFSPPILGEFEITQEQPYRAQYRIVVHDGPADPKLFDRMAAEYGDPLTASR
ncbi:hypothetical protein Pan44_03340 [Caulifigura coniformis]|uniref:Methane oxygenase PmoA n=1 Tax=Caulifigura coniformis TaxID=2527983 RepID=A0A517S872_9PLAN|nr:PmoA family protein [Caulifigura coniformis]QDT52325.1 hypothetical protein Pan44_03340 [Caulifigura coniformis]